MSQLIAIIDRFKFRYSLVVVLILCTVLLSIIPFYAAPRSDQHWQIWGAVTNTFQALLVLAVKYYFDEKQRIRKPTNEQ